MADNPRVRFMAALAKLTAPARAEDATASLVSMLPMLTDIPERAWTSRSCLDALATARPAGVPGYAEIRKALAQWLRDNPDRMQISGPEGGLSPMDERWVAYAYTRRSEGYASVGDRPATSEAHVLSLIKAQSPRAWEHITGKTEHRARPTPAEIDAVSETMTAWRHEQESAKRPDTPRQDRHVTKPIPPEMLAEMYARSNLTDPRGSAS